MRLAATAGLRGCRRSARPLPPLLLPILVLTGAVHRGACLRLASPHVLTRCGGGTSTRSSGRATMAVLRQRQPWYFSTIGASSTSNGRHCGRHCGSSCGAAAFTRRLPSSSSSINDRSVACRLPRCSMSLIDSGDMFGIYAAVATSAAAGLSLERTRVGGALSGAVCSMLIASLLVNVGVLPAAGSVHIGALQMFAVKLATPLLLLGADLRKVFRETGSLLRVFALAACGTALGATLATFLLCEQLAAVDGAWRVLAALAAKNIGGGLNFVAAAQLLSLPSATCVTALAVDNLLGLLYFPFVGWLGRGEPRETDTPITPATAPQLVLDAPTIGSSSAAAAPPLLLEPPPSSSAKSSPGSSAPQVSAAAQTVAPTEGGALPPADEQQEAPAGLPSAAATSTSTSTTVELEVEFDTVTSTSTSNTVEVEVEVDPVQASSQALAFGLCLAAAAEAAATRTLHGGGPLISTALAVSLATLLPRRLSPLVPPAEQLGRQLLFLFFASVGASAGTVGAALRAQGAAPLLAFGTVMYAVHLAVAVGVGARLPGVTLKEALIASNAAVGNAATASAMAAGKGWRSLVLPALLVGTLGNAVGTAAGVGLGTLVLRPLMEGVGVPVG